MLRLDLRSLAFMRVMFGLALLVDSCIRWFDVTRFYSDDGVLPRAVLLEQGWNSYFFSFHMASGQPWFLGLLSALQVCFAIALILGYRTRLSTFVSWLLLISIQNRNQWILNGGDAYARMVLFWMIFIPWGQVWSLDAGNLKRDTRWWTAAVDEDHTTKPSFTTFAYLMQVCILYWFAAIPKSGIAWTADYSAIDIALRAEFLASPFGVTFRETFAPYLATLTFLVIWWEFLGPFLLLFPFDKGEVRTAAVLLFVGMHLGFETTLRIGMFPAYCVTAILGLLPSRFWSLLPRKLVPKRGVAGKPLPPPPSKSLDVLREGAVGLLWIYVFCWNAANEGLRPSLWIPEEWKGIGYTLRFDQRWNMFSPHPPYYDGWWVVRGVRRDSTVVNLQDPGEPLPWSKPADISGMYLNQRRRRWMMEMYMGNTPKKALLDATGRYYVRQMNWRGLSLHELVGVEFYYMNERTDWDGTEFPAERLLVHSYQAKRGLPIPKVPLDREVEK